LDLESLLQKIRGLHGYIQRVVVESCEHMALEDLASVAKEEEGDTLYAVDRISEEILIDFVESEIAKDAPVLLIAEGLDGGELLLPRGISESDALWRIIVDPIDGTRGLMYQKRSAWILTGVAPNLGPATNLQDIELAVQTEIPLVKQYLADSVWAIRGNGVKAERLNRLTGERHSLSLRPSTAKTIAHGFASVARFFPGAREELSEIDEELMRAALGTVQPGKAQCFEDQYISTGGQLYELMAGHDRFIADIRPVVEELLNKRGLKLGICCHPYDICTELIARELGVVITDANGHPIRARLKIDEDVAWIGYANEHIRKQLEPLLQDAFRRRGLI
jgi:fructose-1,6-bisphosphatase/inositol monophosphatase family enzyme